MFLTMLVKVILSADLHELIGAEKLNVSLPENSTVKDLILRLGSLNNAILKLLLRNGELNENYIVIVNGRDIHWLNELNTALHDGDEVLIAPKAFIS